MQNPGPYGNVQNQGPYGNAPVQGPGGKASIGMDANLAAALGYVIGIIGIIVLCTEKENKYVKFHALQSLLFHVGAGVVFSVGMGVVMVIYFILIFLGVAAAAATSNTSASGAGGAVGVIFWIVGVLLWMLIPIFGLGMLVTNILSAVKAFQGTIFRIPIVGKFAANYAKLDD
jgi:uncharacterized membrane protein